MYPMQKNIENKIKCVPCIHVLKKSRLHAIQRQVQSSKKNIFIFNTHNNIGILDLLFRQITTFIRVWPIFLGSRPFN